jgi:hypothetical protein
MAAEAALAEAKEKNPDWSKDKDWVCADKSCPNLYRHARGEACKLRMEDMLLTSKTPTPEDDVNGDPFLSLDGVRFSTHLRKVLVAPTVPMEDQDSEEYCEVTALAVEMMRPSGCHDE